MPIAKRKPRNRPEDTFEDTLEDTKHHDRCVGVALFLYDDGMIYDDGNGEPGTDDQNMLDFAEKDCEKLVRLFREEFMYNVRQLHNLDKKRLQSKCESTLKDYEFTETFNRILVYFSGHGENGAIVLNGEKVLITDMISWFNNDSLKDTIRMFFFDTCRVETETREEPTNTNRYDFLSKVEGILVAYSCLPSSKAYGDSTDKGSFWTNCLFQALKQSKMEDSVHDVLIETNRMLKEELTESEKSQIPVYSGQGLRQNVYFRKEANRARLGAIPGISCQSHLSHHMSKYCQYLKGRYRSLELISIDDQLDCSSSKYVSLTLVKIDRQGRTTSTENRRGDNVTLSEALDVEGEIKKVILIKGDPGMGKSTLAINICKCWAEGGLLQTYNAVILLTLRDPEIQAAKTISDLLLTEGKLRDNVLEEIIDCLGERICFLLEGYDELPEQLRKSSVFTKLKEKLPNCTLVYTSRPEACDKLESVASKIITIEGFKKESVDECISNTFDCVDNGENLASQLKSQLRLNQIITEILHIPINVAIVCVIFFHFSTLPETLTELYTLLCLRLILRYITVRTVNVAKVEILRSLDHLPEGISEQFSQLCFIAYKGTENGNIIFTSQDLLDIGIVENKMSDLGLLVTAPSTSVYGREKSYNFLHKTLQEFSTAWYISKLSLQDQLKCINTYCNDDNYIMVWRFYSGITGLNNKEVLNCILPYKLVKSCLTVRRLQHLMDCVYEAHNSELCHIVGDHLDGNIDVGYYPAHVIDYFLTHYKGTMRQVHCELYWNDDEFQLLVTLLQRRQSQHNNDNLILNIPDRRITHQSFSLLVQLMSTQYPIVELNINWIKVQSTSDMVSTSDYPNSNVTSTHMVLSQLFTSSNTLSVLDISDNDIGPEGAACFADLRNVLIRDLRMASCQLSPTGADKIGEFLYHNNSIVSIDLSRNDIKDSGVERLVYHLNKNNKLQHLNLRGNEITAVGANHLRRLITTDHPTVTSIELSCNPLKVEGVHVILSSLTVTMEHIGLRRVDMTSSSCPIIGASLNKIKSISFDLYDDDYEVMSLANTTVLKQLELDCITSDSANHKMLSAIRQSDNIETLKLHYWYIKGWVADITKLLEYSKTLTQLTIRGYKQPSQDILLIADSLTVNNSVKTFKYGDDYMDQTTTLKFLEQLKQANTVEEVILGVSDKAYGDYRFLGDVEKCVQQINHIRSTKDVSSLVKVEIVAWLEM